QGASSACRGYCYRVRHIESSCAAHGLPFDAFAELATKLSQHLVSVALLNDTLNAAIKAVTILVRQIFGGYDHDGNVLPIFSGAPLVKEFEPVHLRHHQVENDHVRPRCAERFDRNLAIFRLAHLPAERLEDLEHNAAAHLVIVDEKRSTSGRAADAGQCLD